MTKEITKAVILQEMQDRLKLRELEPDIFSFSEMVIPTYDIHDHLKRWVHKKETVSITSAAAFMFFEVPSDEQWLLTRYNMVFLGAGAIKITGMYLVRKETPGYFLYLDMKEAQTISYAIALDPPVILHSADKLCVLCDDYTSTQNFTVYLDVVVEKIR